ncbi:MAG: LysM peptidoglycan-binding domain-containing protein [Rhodoglobus sp.]
MTTISFDSNVFGSNVGARVTPIRPRSQAVPKLRITKRGRAVLLFLVALPLVVAAFLFATNGGGATATLEGSSVPFQFVTVEPGESLWQVAETISPSSDPRDVIDAIVKLNALESADVAAGQQLAIPPQYLQH